MNNTQAQTNGLDKVVRDVLMSMGLLNDAGQLKPIDSLAVIDLLLELEEATKLEISPEFVGEGTFNSVDSIVAFLQKISEPGQS